MICLSICSKELCFVTFILVHRIDTLFHLPRCGSGAVVGFWESYLLMIGPTKETDKYPFPLS